MISASNNNQNKGKDNLPDETDKLLSDKYILAKEIRDLIKTLKNSKTTLCILEIEIDTRLKLKDQLEKYIKQINNLQKETSFPALNISELHELIEKYNSDQDFAKLPETIKINENDIIGSKQLLTDNILSLNLEIKNLREKTESINLADADAFIELDAMKALLKDIEEEISGHKYEGKRE